MTNDPMHSPSPEFRAGLEAEILRAYRREARLGPRVAEHRRRRWRSAGLIAACLAIGLVSGIVPAQVQESARRDSLLGMAQAELQLIALRVNLARAKLEQESQKAKVGAAEASAVAAAEMELRAMEARATRAKLNIDEIHAGSQPPRDELNAPLVGGRDFVRERIELDLANAQHQLSAAERNLETVEERVRMGAVSELARAAAQLEVARTRSQLAVLAERLSLRREFVEKGTPADALVTRLESAQAREDLAVAQLALGLAKSRAETVERQRAVGAASDLDAMRAQVEVKEREQELAQLRLRMRMLRINQVRPPQ